MGALTGLPCCRVLLVCDPGREPGASRQGTGGTAARRARTRRWPVSPVSVRRTWQPPLRESRPPTPFSSGLMFLCDELKVFFSKTHPLQWYKTLIVRNKNCD